MVQSNNTKEIYINDAKTTTNSSNLKGLVEELGIKGTFIAISVNNDLVQRSSWEDQLINHQDKIEIIAPVGGG